MKTIFTLSVFIFCISIAAAQPVLDTTLKEQKENVIKEYDVFYEKLNDLMLVYAMGN